MGTGKETSRDGGRNMDGGKIRRRIGREGRNKPRGREVEMTGWETDGWLRWARCQSQDVGTFGQGIRGEEKQMVCEPFIRRSLREKKKKRKIANKKKH